jgi:TPR repeat protein
VRANPAEAVRRLRRAAEAGHLDATEFMADACREGTGCVPADLAASYRWSMRGAEAGSASSQYNVGFALLEGMGVPVDEAAAVRWFRRASDAGNALEQFALYVCHDEGTAGLRADDPAALQVLRSAAEAGHAPAQNVLGRRLLVGEGMPVDSVAGVEMLRRAVAGGSVNACVYLGDAHARGLGGLPVDVAAARDLYERVAAVGDAHQARDARARLHELATGRASSMQPGATVAPVCGHASCGAALDAGTLSGLCAGCRAVRYCNSGCQRAGWPAHRASCQAASAARKAATAAATPSPASAKTPSAAPTAALIEQRAEVETWERMPLKALRQAAEAGVAAAQAALGEAYAEGVHGLTRDEAAGLAWLRKAAAGGMLPPAMRLASAAVRAVRTAGPADTSWCKEAESWARPAAEAGDAEAQLFMFTCCLQQAGADSGPAAAVLWAESAQWLRLAAAQGYARAIEMMATTLWVGEPRMGVARDRVEARRLYAASDRAGATAAQRAKRPPGAPGSLL